MCHNYIHQSSSKFITHNNPHIQHSLLPAHAGFLLGFDAEDEGNMFLRNVG
jgi:hypothetical protein